MSGADWGVRDLVVCYGRHRALEGVTLDVPAGSVTVVVGGDGSGKTTLLRAVAGVLRPTGGRVRRPNRERIGYVSAASGVYRDLTVDENLAFAARAYRLPPERFNERRDLLQRIGLADAGGRLAGQLSGGMRQKLAFAMAALHEPALLVLDEPTTGVDPVSRAELWRLVARAAASGAGVLLATTYLDEAERAATVCVLDRGRALLTGSPQDVPRSVHGTVYALPAAGRRRPGPAAWRRGGQWRLWSPDGRAPEGVPEATVSRPDLADAVIVAALQAGAAGGGEAA